MSDLFWLFDRLFARMRPYFPISHGIPRTNDHRVISGIIHVIRNELRWRDAPTDYGPHTTLYNRVRAMEPNGRVRQDLQQLETRKNLALFGGL